MSIDWITVGAQIVNFLVLVWLLKRFLYRPILDGIDARENAIAARMSEARLIREQAQAAEADHIAQIAKLKAGREGVIAGVREAAQQERDTLLANVRERLQREQKTREAERAQEARRYTESLQHSGASAILALTRKALHDLADETFEQRVVARAMDHIADKVDDLKEAAGTSQSAVITTHAPLSQKLCAQLDAQLAATLPDIKVDYRTDPDQSPGLCLRLGGVQIDWTLDSYVDGLAQVLKEQRHAKEHADAA